MSRSREAAGCLTAPPVGGQATRPLTCCGGINYQWRERSHEADFVTLAGRSLTAIEVKGSRAYETQRGLSAFAEAHTSTRMLVVGGEDIALEEFLGRPVEHRVKA